MSLKNLFADDSAVTVFDWLCIRLDLSIFERTDLHSRMMIQQIEDYRVNSDQADIILCRCFVGGSRQLDEFNTARRRAELFYKNRGIKLIVDIYENDWVKNVLKLNPTELTDRLLEADFHLFITHFHEGSIAKTSSWNMPNILSNLDRLKFHLGNLMGDMNSCPIFRQGKREVYEVLPDYCLPTIMVDLPMTTWDGKNPLTIEDADRIHNFVKMVETHYPELLNIKKEYVIKLPFAAGGVVRDKGSVKYGIGALGILKSIREFLKNHPCVLGYIHYIIIQPRFPYATEAKVVCFGGKAVFLNPHKHSGGRSTLGDKPEPLFNFANEICRILSERFPSLIGEQILRADFFQHVETGRYYLNEVEGFNAQIVGTGKGNAPAMFSKTKASMSEYWFRIICALGDYHLRRRVF